jgi:hypothetical protein
MAFGDVLAPIINRTAFLYEIGGQNIGFLQLDATVKESHKRTSRITANEIEEGSNIADNVILDNKRFTIEGIISEVPFPSNDIRDIASQVLNSGFDALSGALGAISGGILPDTSATIKRTVALIQLENFWENRVPFQVITGLKKYDNVIIKNMDIPVNVKDGMSLRFTVDCESVKIVVSQNAVVPELSSLAGAVGDTSIGKQAGALAGAADSSSGSILFNAFN